jgi:hypothetical protein
MGRLLNTYPPSGPLVVSREKPVEVCVAVTFAPFTAPPLASATDPVICTTAVACGKSGAAHRKNDRIVP